MLTSEGVYWCTRDLQNFNLANHHFILLVSSPERLKSLSIGDLREESGTFFMTLATFEKNGNLEYKANDEKDVHAVRQGTGKGKGKGLDFQAHKVDTPPGMSDFELIQKVSVLVHAYTNKKKPLKYSLANNNCAAWINTILKHAGIPKNEREKLCQFEDIDWGEKDCLPDWCFNTWD